MQHPKLTLVVGASENPQRYSNIATKRLVSHGHPVIAYGLRDGIIGEIPISKSWPQNVVVDTVTLYVGPDRQAALIPQIIELHPKRVIFNPGTENPDFYKQLDQAKIAYLEACTLVLLSVGDY
jgi:predicted CoA-binding protein